MSRARFALLLLTSGILAAGCANESSEDETAEDEQAITIEGEYAFRHEFPATRLFDRPFTKAFPIEIERRGVKVKATVTPTVKLSVSSPVVEGKVTVGRRGRLLFRAPTIMDAEVKASSSYKANLTVDIDVDWNNTERLDVMREITKELETKLNGGKALELASRLGETNIPIRDSRGQVRSDIPLKGYYDVAVTCSFEEIDGDVQAKLEAGARGTVIARAIYNKDGVERRRFARDPTKKFELDTSNFQMDPQPTFRFTGFRQHIKGSCAVQPSIVVAFDNGVGASLRVDMESSFEAQLKLQAGEQSQWEYRAKPEISIWGETDILLPLVHHNLNTEKQLYAHQFPEIRRDVEDEPPTAPDPNPAPADPATGGCFSFTLQKQMPELSCVQSRTNQLWFQCKKAQWFRSGDSQTGPYGACSSSHPI